MDFYGFQKMTLLDYPGKVACVVFTPECNFRCPFCHNARLVTEITGEEIHSEEEILSYLVKRRGLIDGICVTGGEPLLHPEVRDFLRRVRETGAAIKLDTNGSFPERLDELIREGLVDYVAMDVKNTREKYPETTGLPKLRVDKVSESIRLLLLGRVEYEFRTTVTSEFHTPDDIAGIAEWIHGAKRYFLQNFIDSGNLIGEGLHPVSRDTLAEMKGCAEAVLGKVVAIRGE